MKGKKMKELYYYPEKDEFSDGMWTDWFIYEDVNTIAICNEKSMKKINQKYREGRVVFENETRPEVEIKLPCSRGS